MDSTPKFQFKANYNRDVLRKIPFFLISFNTRKIYKKYKAILKEYDSVEARIKNLDWLIKGADTKEKDVLKSIILNCISDSLKLHKKLLELENTPELSELANKIREHQEKKISFFEKHPFIKKCQTFFNSPKKIILSIVLFIIVMLVFAFIINFVFFHKPTSLYGTNTVCYTNNLTMNFHTKDCGFLNDTPAVMSLLDAIESGYINCPECNENFKLTPISCYITEYGECFHNKNCHYIADSNTIAISTLDAIKEGYAPCSYCISQISTNEQYIVLPTGLYFHKTTDNSSQRDYKQMSHITSLNQYSRSDVKIKETTVYKATKKHYSPCSSCNVGMLDVSHGYTNNYIVSLLISLLSTTVIWFVVLIICYKKHRE